MSFPTYPDRRPSGVEWLGDIPAHWSVERLKRSVRLVRNGIWGDEPQGNEGDLPCVRVADFDRQRFRVVLDSPTLRHVTEKEREGRLLEKGDLLLEKSGGGDVNPVGFVVRYEDTRPAVCSNFVARVVVAEGMDSSFWRYVHAAAYSIRLTTTAINQTSGIQNLDQQRYFDERAAFPPLPEQQAIAAFLDRETAKIDALIAEQEQLIELLAEQRHAITSSAVTKGFDPAIPTKPTGIQWLGDIPTDWKAVTVGRLCREVADGPHFSPSYADEGVLFLSARNIRVDGWSLEDVKYVSEKDAESFDRRVKPSAGDILYTKGGTTGIARVLDLPSRVQVWVHIAVLKLDHTLVDAHFLAFALNSRGAYEQSQLLTRGASNKDLGLTRLVKIWVAQPPLDVQREIASRLIQMTAAIDAQASDARRAIALLQERRSALISAAVTGQIDVRGLAPSEAA